MAALATAAMASGPMPVEGLKVSGKVDLERGGAPGPLVQGRALQQDDVIRTIGDGRVELGLPSSARLTLGSSSELLLHSAEVIAGRSDYVLRAKLVKGLARAEALAPGNGPIPDLRLTAGQMRVRVRDADAWLRSDELGDAVCVVKGTVEAQFADQHLHIKQPGECLRLSPGARAHSVEILPPKAMVVRLGMTTVGGGAASVPDVFLTPEPPPLALPPAIELDRAPPVAPVQDSPPAVARTPVIEDRAAMSEALALEREAQPVLQVQTFEGEPAAAPTPRSQQGWTLVVASVDNREVAERQAQSYRADGLDAAVFEASVKGRTMYRVGIGRYANADEARTALSALARQKPGLKPWVAKF